MSHPFRICHRNLHGIDIFMMHNGVLSEAPIQGQESDTIAFNNSVLKPILQNNPAILYNKDFQSMLGTMIGVGNKLCFLDGLGNVITINNFHTHEDCQVSNTYSVPPTPYEYPEGNYSNYGAANRNLNQRWKKGKGYVDEKEDDKDAKKSAIQVPAVLSPAQRNAANKEVAYKQREKVKNQAWLKRFLSEVDVVDDERNSQDPDNLSIIYVIENNLEGDSNLYTWFEEEMEEDDLETLWLRMSEKEMDIWVQEVDFNGKIPRKNMLLAYMWLYWYANAIEEPSYEFCKFSGKDHTGTIDSFNMSDFIAMFIICLEDSFSIKLGDYDTMFQPGFKWDKEVDDVATCTNNCQCYECVPPGVSIQ